MASIWNPEEVLGLRPRDDQSRGVWLCAARLPEASSEGGGDGTEQRCRRPIRPCEHNTIRRLLADMSHELPDQVDHNLLLHLARACLCVDASPEPHRGKQEASIIYEWTELMCNEAWRLREATPSDPFKRDPFNVESAAAKAEERTRQPREDDDLALSPRSVPRRVVSARTRLQSVSASTISQRRSGGNSPLAASASASPEPSPAAARTPTAALVLSTAHNSAHHPHAPPSPPDSATFYEGSIVPPFPALPIYSPVPMSFGAVPTGANTPSDAAGLFSSARASTVLSPPLPTGTTIQTSGASSDRLSEASSSTINGAAGGDGGDDDDNEDALRTPYAATVFEIPSASTPPTTAQNRFATVAAAAVPPPLPTAMTMVSEGDSSSSISSTGDSSMCGVDDGKIGCAIMSMPPRASVVAAEVAARHQKRLAQQQQQKSKSSAQTSAAAPPSARGRRRSLGRPDSLHLRRVSLSNMLRAEAVNGGCAASPPGGLVKKGSVGPGDSVSVRHLQQHHGPTRDQQRQDPPPMSAVGCSFSPPPAANDAAGDAAVPAAEAALAGQLRECAEVLRGVRAACVADLGAARAELAAVRAEAAAVRAELLETRRAAAAAMEGPASEGVRAAAAPPRRALAAAAAVPHLVLLPLVLLVWAVGALARRLRVDARGGGAWALMRRGVAGVRCGDGDGDGDDEEGALSRSSSSASRTAWAALVAVARPVARLAGLAAAYGERAGGRGGGYGMEPLWSRAEEEVLRGKDFVGKMV